MPLVLTLAKTSSVILANLVIGENVIPEFMQAHATPGKLAPALRDVLDDTPQRRRQLEAFSRLDAIMATGGKPPSVQAADIVLAMLRGGAETGLTAEPHSALILRSRALARRLEGWPRAFAAILRDAAFGGSSG